MQRRSYIAFQIKDADSCAGGANINTQNVRRVIHIIHSNILYGYQIRNSPADTSQPQHSTGRHFAPPVRQGS